MIYIRTFAWYMSTYYFNCYKMIKFALNWLIQFNYSLFILLLLFFIKFIYNFWNFFIFFILFIFYFIRFYISYFSWKRKITFNILQTKQHSYSLRNIQILATDTDSSSRVGIWNRIHIKDLKLEAILEEVTKIMCFAFHLNIWIQRSFVLFSDDFVSTSHLFF